MKKVLSIVLVLTVICASLVLSSTPVSATQSRAGNFDSGYSLTGNGGDDIVRIAEAQIGKTGAQLGYTEHWCADFVSDCALLANQADAIPANGLVETLWKNIKDAGGDEVDAYSAQPGDIAFYGTAHTEIVYAASNGNVSTIGGNSGGTGNLRTNSVKRHATQSMTITSILRPNYGGGHDYPDPEIETWYYDGSTDHSDFRPVIKIKNPETVSEVKFAVRYENTDWKWYEGDFNGGNAWYCDVLSSDLGVGSIITCHAYVRGKNGSYVGYPFTDLSLDKDADPEAINWYYDGATDNSDFRPIIRIANPDTVSYVRFAVRYDSTDWKWYDGIFNGGNAWYCDVLSSDLGTGQYIVCHVYVYAKNGGNKGYPLENLKLDKDYDNPSLSKWEYETILEKQEYKAIMKFDNPETVKAVRFAVRGDNNDWEWFDGVFDGENIWYYTITTYDSGVKGTVYCHAYVQGKNGFYQGYPFPEIEITDTQYSTDPPTDPPTEKPTEKPTEPPTEKPTEKPTEPPTEKPTEKPTEPATEPSTIHHDDGVWVVADGTEYQVRQGQVIDYVYYLNTGEKLASLDAETYFDTNGLELISDTDDMEAVFPILKDAVVLNDSAAGRLKYNYSSSKGKSFNTDDCELIHIQFKVTADKGVYSVNTFLHTVAGANEYKYIFMDEQINPLKRSEGIIIGAEPVILGDADGDGELTILDATRIQRWLAELCNMDGTGFDGAALNSEQKTAADADQDEEVTILDATAIQRHLADLSTNQSIGKPIA